MNNKPLQKIFFGSPGTGKSHKIAEILKDLGIDKTPENVIKTVFHPEYTHGDFLGKLMPMTREKIGVTYTFYEGHFLRALAQAYRNIRKGYDNKGNKIEGYEIKNVALVIDEINRGNSSAIFGSIFQLLDRDVSGDNSGWSSYYISVGEMVFNKILQLTLEVADIEFNSKKRAYSITHYEDDTRTTSEKKEKDFKKEFIGTDIDLSNRTIKIPPNLSILATMNTSDSSIYYMDSAFKRRWEWEFIDVDSKSVCQEGVAFDTEEKWKSFVDKLNSFILSKHKYIRGIEDKQVGYFFIREMPVLNATIQNKLMFFIWDNVFSRDKKPLVELLYGEDKKTHDELVTFGQFAKQVDQFIEKIKNV